MMAPDYAHWHGMYEVAERFYQELIPQARELADHAETHGNPEAATAVRTVIDELLARPEHEWFEAQKKPREPPADASDTATTDSPSTEQGVTAATEDASTADEGAAEEEATKEEEATSEEGAAGEEGENAEE